MSNLRPALFLKLLLCAASVAAFVALLPFIGWRSPGSTLNTQHRANGSDCQS